VRRGLDMISVDELDNVLRIALQPAHDLPETRPEPIIPPTKRRPGVTGGVRAT